MLHHFSHCKIHIIISYHISPGPSLPHPSRPWEATWAVWVWPENGPSHTALVNPPAWHRYAARAPQSLGYHNGHCCRSSVDLAKLQKKFTNLDFTEIRGFPFLSFGVRVNSRGLGLNCGSPSPWCWAANW